MNRIRCIAYHMPYEIKMEGNIHQTLLPPDTSILLCSETPVVLNGWSLVIGICVAIYSNISIYHCSHCSADLILTWKSPIIIALPFLFCSFLHNYILSCDYPIPINIVDFHCGYLLKRILLTFVSTCYTGF